MEQKRLFSLENHPFSGFYIEFLGVKGSNKKLGAVSFTYPSEVSCQARYLDLYIARFSKRLILRWPTPTPHPPLWLLFWPSPYPFPAPPPHPLPPGCILLEQRFGFAYRPDHDVVQNCYVVVSQEESSQYFASPCPLAIEGVWIETHCNSFYGNVCSEFDSPKDRISFPQHSRWVPPLLPW